MSKTHSVKTYSRKPLARASVQFDAIISGNTSGSRTSASAAAVSVARWGQTTFTSVRRQRELESAINGGNGSQCVDNDLKRARIEMDNKSEIVKVIPTKPRVNKFFKSRANALFDDIVKEKIIKDKEEMINAKVIDVRNETIKNTKSYKSDLKTNKWTDSVSKDDIKPQFIGKKDSENDNDSDNSDNWPQTQMMYNSSSPSSSDEEIDTKCERVIQSDDNHCNKRVNLKETSSVKGTRQSRRLKGDAPEVIDNQRRAELITYNKTIESSGFGTETKIDEIQKNNEILEMNESIKNRITYSRRGHTQEIHKHIDKHEHNDEKVDDNDQTVIISQECDPISPLKEQILPLKEPLPLFTFSSQPIPQSQLSIDIEEDPSPSSSSQPSVSSDPLPVPKPKKRIFFSKSKNNRATAPVVFNPKNFWAGESSDIHEFDEELGPSSSGTSSSTAVNNKKADFDFGDDENDYIQLRRIKKANQCHELGETEQFDGDIKFYLSGIESSNSISMRCLSILGLSQQTMRPEFRLHLRAHDDMSKIISALMDAPSDPNLALCTATLMFIYNLGGRLNMDINANALSLMLQLLETRTDECNIVEQKHRDKVKTLCEEIKKAGHAQYLNLNEITAGKLAMETLLGLTSKRANNDTLKDEMRKLKGIDFILNTVVRCADFCNDDGQMIKIDRCMHVLENVTLDNVQNQMYILNYDNGHVISVCIKLLHSCKHQIIVLTDSKVFLSAFFSILRVLTHLTSESVNGCSIIGSYDGIIDLLLESVFELPSFILPDQRFDLMVILLCLCINLLEFCPMIRSYIIGNTSRLTQIIKLLFQRINDAQETEQQADELLENHEIIQMNEAMRDSILTQILAKSGKHMEHSIIAACISLLLGCTIQDNYKYNCILKEHLPNSSHDQLVEVLQKLRDFAYLADIMTTKGKERVERIINVFKNT